MANIFKTSIGKKVIMSITGLFLILFITLHCVLNGAYLISDDAFDAVCEFMALPVVTVMVPVLALGFIFHIIYAFIISWEDYKARGRERYEVANSTRSDGWASKNMLVLGALVLIGLALHLVNFWAKMQLQDFMGIGAEPGSARITATFGNVLFYVLYIIWFVCLWFHLNHGFWSAFHTIGFSNDKWICRLRWIGIIYSTLLVIVFIAVATKGLLVAKGICF